MWKTYHCILLDRDVLDPFGEPGENHNAKFSNLIRSLILGVLAKL